MGLIVPQAPRRWRHLVRSDMRAILTTAFDIGCLASIVAGTAVLFGFGPALIVGGVAGLFGSWLSSRSAS
jgi:preprotein translocase subunit SecF